MMRAGRMVEVGRFECEAAPIPEIDDGQVLVRSEMASICGSDLHVVCMGAGIGWELPAPIGYPGHEGIGEVMESRAAALPVGTQVLCFPHVPVGECFAEYQRISAGYCLPLPASDLPRSHLLMAQQLGTVIFALRQHPRDVTGETVVILGQGSAGLFFTHLLKRAGAARVIVADLSPIRLAVSTMYGADVAVNAATDDIRMAVRDLTGGLGADYVVEAVGRDDTFLLTTALVRADGELLWFGLPSTDEPIAINFASFFRKRLRAASTYGAQEEPGATSFGAALEMIRRGDIDVGPLLSHVLPIESVGDAFRLAHDPVAAGAVKVSVRFS
jgi:threonine dehydrogenase-like Zn-dependent dehydrogenase